VLVGDLEHLRVQRGQHAGEHVGREALQVADAHAVEHLRDPVAQLVRRASVEPVEAEQQVRRRVAGQLAAVHEPGAVGRAANWNALDPAISVRSRSKNAAPGSSARRSAPPPGGGGRMCGRSVRP
jgi:hypothetical protein